MADIPLLIVFISESYSISLANRTSADKEVNSPAATSCHVLVTFKLKIGHSFKFNVFRITTATEQLDMWSTGHSFHGCRPVGFSTEYR